jgi:hypothetical protein
MMFTEHCAKQGMLAQATHMYKNEEELSKRHNALEAAFRRFEVCLSSHKSMTALS